MDQSWVCACCGQRFDSLPMRFVTKAPDNWFGLTDDERQTRAELDEDLCIIDGSEFYVHGNLEIPVLDHPEPLVFGVWLSISKPSLERIIELRNIPVVENEPPRFGWLCTWLRGYPRPDAIRCRVHIPPGDLRPLVELQPTDYPLAVEQRSGITLERVKEIAALSGHP